MAASGNHNTVVNYPAAYSSEFDNVISVGASTKTDTRAGYSNYGYNLDLVAPVGSGEMYQETYLDADTWNNDLTPIESRDFTTFGYKAWAGTSFAAPQVAATAAILKSKNSDMPTSEIKQTIKASSTDVSALNPDNQTGSGILNIDESYNTIWDQWQYATPNTLKGTIITKSYDTGVDHLAIQGFRDNTNNEFYYRTY